MYHPLTYVIYIFFTIRSRINLNKVMPSTASHPPRSTKKKGIIKHSIQALVAIGIEFEFEFGLGFGSVIYNWCACDGMKVPLPFRMIARHRRNCF